MRRRTESNRLLCAVFTWLAMLAMCMPSNAQKNIAASLDYEYELALYRPQITLASDGGHAIAWESLAKLHDSEEWQIGTRVFNRSGAPLDEAIYLRDPVSCVDDEIEGYRGVQNADLKFNKDGELLVAMEPVIEVYDGYLHKQPRTILSRMDQTGHVDFHEAQLPCQASVTDSAEDYESERPRFGLVPQTGEIVLVSSQQGIQGPQQRNTIKTISLGEGAFGSSFLRPSNAADSFKESWHDVAVGNRFSGYSWQRCYPADGGEEMADCDIVVKFVPHTAQTNVVHTTKPIRVNSGDTFGVLNFRPSIAMNESGESVVVWIDYRFSERGDVLAQRFDSTGWPIGDNERISDGYGFIDEAEGVGPEVAMKNDGSYMVVWTQDDGDGRRAYGRVVSGKDTSDSPFLLDVDPHVESRGADVTSNGVHFGYTWISETETGTNVYYWIAGSDSFVAQNLESPQKNLTFTGYPNPFSKETTLQYELSNEGHVTLVIYDILGREVKKLIDKWQAPGSYLVNVPAGDLAIGYYVTKLQQGDLQFSKVLIRTP